MTMNFILLNKIINLEFRNINFNIYFKYTVCNRVLNKSKIKATERAHNVLALEKKFGVLALDEHNTAFGLGIWPDDDIEDDETDDVVEEGGHVDGDFR